MLKLKQDQVWQQGDKLIRIVRLARLEVDYKITESLHIKNAQVQKATKKEFCRLIKGATVLPSSGIVSAPPGVTTD